ncbi:MAG TPA: ATP synthase F1 subunit epsilon, partial [Bacillota bacterium]|nr:ATP synthase F1 subunit epsilon [Bacillota bacterium]
MAKTEEKNTMMLEVVTPYQHFYEGRVDSVTLSTLDGELGICPGHSPLVVALTPGISRIVENSKTKYAVMTEGYAEIGQHIVVVVCNAAEWPEDIDVARARAAFDRASKRYHDAKTESDAQVYARHSIRRARVRIKAVEMYGTDKQK